MPTNIDAMTKKTALDLELEWAKSHLDLETLETRGRDGLDFHDLSVDAIRALIRHAFESGYREGLHTGYRQGRTDAAREAIGREAPSSPRNPQLPTT